MRSIARVFGRSPFVPLQAHMEKVAECVRKLPATFDAYERGDLEAVRQSAKEISKLEFEADQVKHDIRNSLPRGLFMPMDRGSLLNILARQDDIADKAENVAVILSFKIAKSCEPFKSGFRAFFNKNIEAFEAVHEVVGQLDELIESGFGGTEAQHVKELVQTVAELEHEVDLLQRDLIGHLLENEQELTHGDFYLWTRLIRQVSAISNLAENLGNTIRMTLETK